MRPPQPRKCTFLLRQTMIQQLQTRASAIDKGEEGKSVYWARLKEEKAILDYHKF